MQEAVDSAMIENPFFCIVLAFLVRLWPGVTVELTMSLAAGAIDTRQLRLVLDKVVVTIATLDPTRHSTCQ